MKTQINWKQKLIKEYKIWTSNFLIPNRALKIEPLKSKIQIVYGNIDEKIAKKQRISSQTNRIVDEFQLEPFTTIQSSIPVNKTRLKIKI